MHAVAEYVSKVLLIVSFPPNLRERMVPTKRRPLKENLRITLMRIQGQGQEAEGNLSSSQLVQKIKTLKVCV